MGYRTFTDRDGNRWEVRDRSTSEWSLEPARGNPHPAVRITAPSHQNDPFEVSIEELQRMLDDATGGRGGRPRTERPPSPFRD